MQNLNAYFQYLEDIARDHKSILHQDAEEHFFRTDIEELDNALRSKIHFPALAAMNPFIDGDAQALSNTRITWRGSFILLDRVKDKGDFAERNSKEAALMAIAKDIIQKNINDRRNFTLPGLDISAFKMELVPERYVPLCGVLVSFSYNESLGQFDPSRWNNNPIYQP
jgi:hypothetical protein